MTYAKKLCGMEMGSTSFESPVGVDQAMRKKILKNGMDCALPLVGGNVTHRGGGEEVWKDGEDEHATRKDDLCGSPSGCQPKP